MERSPAPGPPSGSAARPLACLALALLAGFHLVTPLRAQVPSVDTAALGEGPQARLHMLLERTIFRVDVLALEVRLGADAAARLQAVLGTSAGGPDPDALRDSVAAIALDARDALTRLEFERNISLDRFLDGIRRNLRRAARAGIVSPADYRSISASLPGWYAFLEGRGLRSGDRMLQRVRGDTLRTVYVSASGETLLDQVDVGPERRLAVLGGYFAPGSDFREGLIDSVLEAR